MVGKLSETDYIKIKKNIIKKLYSKKAFSRGHLLYERLTTSIPPHQKGYVDDILKDLIKEGIVLHYNKTFDFQNSKKSLKGQSRRTFKS